MSYDSFITLLVCKDLRNGLCLRKGCSGYIRRQLMLRDEHVYLWLLLKPLRQWLAANPTSFLGTRHMANYVRKTAPSVTWHLPFVFARAPYSIPLWPKESGHLSPVRDSVDLFVPAGWINPFKHRTHSITTISRAHPIEHVFPCLYLGYSVLGIIN